MAKFEFDIGDWVDDITKDFTNRWGQTVPYDLVANVLEYGSSKVKATHFMSRAFKAARPKAQEAMRQVVHQKMTELLARK